MKLTWDDLMIAQVPETELQEYLGWLDPILPKGTACRTVFFNRVGEWFLQTQDQRVHKVSNLTGVCATIASTYDEFTGLVNRQQWQEEHLRSLDILRWKSEGHMVGANQVYAFVPHPAVSGKVSGQVMPMDLRIWLWISAQTLGFVPKQ